MHKKILTLSIGLIFAVCFAVDFAKADTTQVLRFSTEFQNATGEILQSEDTNWSVSVRGTTSTTATTKSSKASSSASSANITSSSGASSVSESATSSLPDLEQEEASSLDIASSSDDDQGIEFLNSSQDGDSSGDSTSVKTASSTERRSYVGISVLILVVVVSLIFLFVRWRKNRTENETASEENLFQSFVFRALHNRIVPACLIIIFIGGIVYFVISRQSYEASQEEEKTDFGKYVVWVGWSPPTLDQLANNVEWQNNDLFDGIVLQGTQITDGRYSFLNDTFNTRANLIEESFQTAADKWNNVVSSTGKLKHSLLRVNLIGGNTHFNWGQESEQINTSLDTFYSNWLTMIRWAMKNNTEGIYLDTEKANSDLLAMLDIPNVYNDIDLESLYNQNSEDAIFLQAKNETEERAFQFGKRLSEGATNVLNGKEWNVMLTFCSSHFAKSGDYWTESNYELLPAFYDGLLAGSGANIHFYDGNESAYPTKTTLKTARQKFAEIRGRVYSSETASYSRDPDLYLERTGASYGLWLDYDQKRPWLFQRDDGIWLSRYRKDDGTGEYVWTTEPSEGLTTENNWFIPSLWQESLREAMLSTDKYVWVYTQRPNLWSTSTNHETNPPIAEAYIQAMMNLRETEDLSSPTCVSSGDQNIIVGHSYTGSAYPTVTEDNDNVVNTQLLTSPDGVTWDKDMRIFHYTPTSSDVGNRAIAWQVSDGLKTSTCTTVLKIIDSTPSLRQSVTKGDSVIISGQIASFQIHLENYGNDTALNGKLKLYVPSNWKLYSSGNLISDGYYEIPLNSIDSGQSTDLVVEIEYVG